MGTEINDRIPAPGLEIWGSIADLRRSGPFECISLWHSLEHLRDPATAIRDLVEMLRPGGVLVIAVPNAGGWQARLFGRHWLHLDAPRHLHHFGMRSLNLLISQCGLQPLRTWHHEVEYDWFGWIQSFLNVIMPRPNVLFDFLTRRPTKAAVWLTGLNVLLAVPLVIPAFIATVVSTWAREGGTIIVAAQTTGARDRFDRDDRPRR
jgi:SAM-dependent methyltransferase